MWTANPDQIRAALDRIDPVFLDTPLRRSEALDEKFGAQLLFKDETASPIRSFKGRGACNFVSQLPNADGLVCASAGNFGQGMAWAARSKGVGLTVFASVNAVRSKIEAMRSLGATIVLEGEDFDAAKDAAAAFAAAASQFYVEDGAHAAIAEGAGTIVVELTERGEGFDAILAPLGNGALAAGVGCWTKHNLPEAQVVAVSARGAPAMAQSVRDGTIVVSERADTIADGIAVRVPIPSAVHAVRSVVDAVVLVDDDDIRAAMKLLQEALGLVVEPAGAAGFAAILAEPLRWRGQRIAIPLCGGNV
jgi:threonine dehydratase